MRPTVGRPRFVRYAAIASVLLGLLLAVAPRDSQAGVFRNFLEKMHVVTPPPAPSSAMAVPRQGYACCDLHYRRDSINDGNYAELPLIPAGTPIEVVSYGSNRAEIKVEGKPMHLVHDYGAAQEPLQTWVDKVVPAEDPRPRIAKYPAAVREAIRQGKVMAGMTREQAITSIGYPLTSENAVLDAPMWRIWRSTREEYDVHFGADGRVESITGDDAVLAQVVYRPAK